MGKLHWINREKLIDFVLEAQVSCQDQREGPSADAISRIWKMEELQTDLETGWMSFTPFSVWQVSPWSVIQAYKTLTQSSACPQT